jgi:hypothetical protein
MFTLRGKKVGVRTKLVPTNASEVNVRVCTPVTLDAKPKPVKVAIPSTAFTVSD